MHQLIVIENLTILDMRLKGAGGCKTPLSFLISRQYISTQTNRLATLQPEKRSAPAIAVKRVSRSRVSKRKAVDA